MPHTHYLIFAVVQSLSRVWLLRPYGWQHARLPCPSLSLEFAQTHVHWVDDAIQPSHPQGPASPPSLNLSQHKAVSQGVSFSHQAAKGLELHLQHQTFQLLFRVDFLLKRLTGLISLLSRRLSRVFSSNIVQKHQFFGSQPSLWSNSHIHAWLLEKP